MTSKKKPAVPTSGSPVGKTSGVADESSPLSLTPAQRQIESFEQAVRQFSHQRFAEAITLFEEARRGPAPHVADKARSYIQVCNRKLAHQHPVDLHCAEDYFNYGVERLNARDIDQARAQLSKALDLAPDTEYILYTMALACGMAGDGDGAYENLKRAIELEPKNRILARQDPEFSALTQQIPQLRVLLQTGPSGSL